MFYITCFEKMIFYKGKLITGYLQTLTFRSSKDAAIQYLHNNGNNTQYGLFNYAVLEEIRGKYKPGKCYRQFFKWDKRRKGFYEIKNPIGIQPSTRFAFR